MGVGNNSCIKWTQAKAEKAGDRIVYEQWLLGFITGLDFATQLAGGSARVTLSDNLDDLIRVVDDYCAGHPLDTVATATQHLWLALFNRSQAK